MTTLISFLANNIMPDLAGVNWSDRVLGEANSVAGRVQSWNLAAQEAGWSRDVDQEDVPCFMNSNGVHEYSYAKDWRDLCSTQQIDAALVEDLTGMHSVSAELAEYLMERCENIVRIGDNEIVWFQTDQHDLMEHPVLMDAKAALDETRSTAMTP